MQPLILPLQWELWPVGDSFYVVEEGSFLIHNEAGSELAKIGKGSCFGELALLRQVVFQPFFARFCLPQSQRANLPCYCSNVREILQSTEPCTVYRNQCLHQMRQIQKAVSTCILIHLNFIRHMSAASMFSHLCRSLHALRVSRHCLMALYSH